MKVLLQNALNTRTIQALGLVIGHMMLTEEDPETQEDYWEAISYA